MPILTDDLLIEITRRIVSEIKPERVFIFGSRAWGTPTEGSDLDLMVVVSEGAGSVRSLKQRARQCLRDIFFPMDILVEPVGLFDRRSTVHASLESLIAEKGIRLHG